jgi:hypothetical protein
MSDKTQERRIADATTALEAFCPYYHGLAPSLAVLAKVAVRAADAPKWPTSESMRATEGLRRPYARGNQGGIAR